MDIIAFFLMFLKGMLLIAATIIVAGLISKLWGGRLTRDITSTGKIADGLLTYFLIFVISVVLIGALLFAVFW